MIQVNQLWKRTGQYGVKYQAGQNLVDAFNGALDEVQLELYNQLAPIYQSNEKVRSLLAVWVKKQYDTASNGTYTVGNSQGLFDRVVGMSVTDTTAPTPNILYAIEPIMEAELTYAARIPQRAPSLAKKRVYYLVDGPTTINLYPAAASIPFLLFYLVFPTAAYIAFTYTETDDEYIQTYDPTNSQDLAWTSDAFNLILYMMLDKFGVSVREQLLMEYAKLGLTELMSQPTKEGNQ